MKKKLFLINSLMALFLTTSCGNTTPSENASNDVSNSVEESSVLEESSLVEESSVLEESSVNDESPVLSESSTDDHSGTGNENSSEEPILDNHISISQALEIASTLASNGQTEETYVVTGVVKSISSTGVVITDGENDIIVYAGASIENAYIGYEVTFEGAIKNYYTGYEVVEPTLLSFVATTYNASVAASLENGTITLSKTEGINHSEQITLQVVANEGYQIKTVSVNGNLVDVDEDGCATISVVSDVVVDALFVSADVAVAETFTVEYDLKQTEEGTQYAQNEKHEFGEYLTIYTTSCHFKVGEIRIYSSSTNDGYVILESSNVINSITFTAGNKADVLNVYGSVDGENYTLVEGVAVTKENASYTVSLDGMGYKYVKLDVAGTNQVRVYELTVRFEK